VSFIAFAPKVILIKRAKYKPNNKQKRGQSTMAKTTITPELKTVKLRIKIREKMLERMKAYIG
jgi:hypothetical protein